MGWEMLSKDLNPMLTRNPWRSCLALPLWSKFIKQQLWNCIMHITMLLWLNGFSQNLVC